MKHRNVIGLVMGAAALVYLLIEGRWNESDAPADMPAFGAMAPSTTAPASQAFAMPATVPAAATPSPGPGPSPTPPPLPQHGAPARAVETHAKGVFFDWRPVRAEGLRVAQASKPSVDRMQPAQVTDNGATALTLEIPQGWQGEGSVVWDDSVGCGWNGARMTFNASSADGLHGIAIFPGMGWQVASQPIDPFDACPAAPMASPRDYLEFIARNARPGARVISYRDRPRPPNALQTYAAGEMLIGYSLQGHEMREYLAVSMFLVPMPTGGTAINSPLALGVRAPDGLLDFAFAERVRASLRPDEQWFGGRYSAWVTRKMQEARSRASGSIDAWNAARNSEINMAGMTARHNIRMGTIAEIGRINTQIFNNTMATGDRMQVGNINAIQEVQPWRDPGTGQQVDLSIHYRHAWQLNDGRQFLTNDPNFDPNRDLDIAGHRLEPVR